MKYAGYMMQFQGIGTFCVVDKDMEDNMLNKLEPGTVFRYKLNYYLVTNISDWQKTTCLRLRDFKLVTLSNAYAEDKVTKPMFKFVKTTFDRKQLEDLKSGAFVLDNALYAVAIDIEKMNCRCVNLSTGELKTIACEMWPSIYFNTMEFVR